MHRRFLKVVFGTEDWDAQRCCLLVLSYGSEGSVITVLVLHWGPQAAYPSIEEQHGPQNTSTNHPSVAIVSQNHMWLWCLFIIMRMRISSIWLLPRKLHSVKYGMCPGTWSWFCAQIQKLQPLLADNILKPKLWIFDARNSLQLSLFHRVWGTLTKTEQEITFHYLVVLQKWLDHLIASFHCFYFLQPKTFPRGIHNHNGFPEILSTRPDAEGGSSCNDVLVLCVDGAQCKNKRGQHLKVACWGVRQRIQTWLFRDEHPDTLFSECHFTKIHLIGSEAYHLGYYVVNWCKVWGSYVVWACLLL